MGWFKRKEAAKTGIDKTASEEEKKENDPVMPGTGSNDPVMPGTGSSEDEVPDMEKEGGQM